MAKFHNRLEDGKKRTAFDLNEIFEYEDYAEVVLYKQNKEYVRVLIDVEDIEKVKDLKWHLDSRNYAKNGKLKTLMHRIIMSAKKGEYVDHINHNTLDNRKNNLRIVTNQQNGMNRSLGLDNTSGCTGVSFNKNNSKWIVQIGVNRRLVYLGHYDTLNEAINVRKQAEVKYFGDYRKVD